MNTKPRSKPVKPSTESSTTPRTPQHDVIRPPSIIVISSDDESAPPGGADEDSVIYITSSDSDCHNPPPASQPRSDSPPPVTQPQTARTRVGRLNARRPPPAPRMRSDSPPLANQPRSGHPRAHHTSPAPPAHGAVESDVIDITSSESGRDTPPPPIPQRNGSSRTVVKPRVLPRDVEARVRPTCKDLEGDRVPGLVQPRAVIRSRAPSLMRVARTATLRTTAHSHQLNRRAPSGFPPDYRQRAPGFDRDWFEQGERRSGWYSKLLKAALTSAPLTASLPAAKLLCAAVLECLRHSVKLPPRPRPVRANWTRMCCTSPMAQIHRLRKSNPVLLMANTLTLIRSSETPSGLSYILPFLS